MKNIPDLTRATAASPPDRAIDAPGGAAPMAHHLPTSLRPLGVDGPLAACVVNPDGSPRRTHFARERGGHGMTSLFHRESQTRELGYEGWPRAVTEDIAYLRNVMVNVVFVGRPM